MAVFDFSHENSGTHLSIMNLIGLECMIEYAVMKHVFYLFFYIPKPIISVDSCANI